MSPVSCPKCIIGTLNLWTVVATKERLQMCDECSATWPEGRVVTLESAVDVDDYLERNGLEASLKQLEVATGTMHPLFHSFSYGNHGVVRAAVNREHAVLKDFIASDLRGTGSAAYREVRAAVEAALSGEPVRDDLTYDAFSVEVTQDDTTIEDLHDGDRALTVSTKDFLATLVAYEEFVSANPDE